MIDKHELVIADLKLSLKSTIYYERNDVCRLVWQDVVPLDIPPRREKEG